MADNEQELLSDVTRKERAKNCVFAPYSSVKEHIDWLCEAQIAKLKAMGYEQVWTKCPECEGEKQIYQQVRGTQHEYAPCPTCKGTGKITKYVKWDREKVAGLLFESERGVKWGHSGTEDDESWRRAEQHYLYLADQLHKELTKEETNEVTEG